MERTKKCITQMEDESKTRILEITLISAQSLKPPSAKLRRLQTYALAWVDSSAKLRTKIDNVGGENPTWNEKFLFRVSPEFLAGETSGVSIEIYAIGYIKDVLVGRVKFLLSSCFKSNKSGRVSIRTPAFSAVHIRRPSGSLAGVVNLGAMVYGGSQFSVMAGNSSPAICFRDLINENDRRLRKEERQEQRLNRGGSKWSEQSSDADSCDFSGGESVDFFSDGTDSTTSSSSNALSAFKDWNGSDTAFKDWNGNGSVRNVKVAGKKDLKASDGGGGGRLCGLMLQRRMSWCPPSDQNLQFFAGLQGSRKY